MAHECVTLRDPSSRATAEIAVGFGFNCFKFAVERNGRFIDVLWSAPDFVTGGARASSSGIPILFPFPGRIPRGVFTWDGQEYRLPAGDGRGNAIHGFVLDRPWRVVEQDEQKVVGEFHASKDDPQVLDLWPTDFRVRATYSLHLTTLSCLIEIDNPDTKHLPFGLGTHPYFQLPLGGSRRDDCLVTLPVREEWELSEMLPTGNRVPVRDAARLQQGIRFGDMQFDNVFTALVHEGGWCRSTITDPDSQVVVEQDFESLFRECVVYTPDHRGAVCVEPYTCVPGPFDLVDRGIDAGLHVLDAGCRFAVRFAIRVR